MTSTSVKTIALALLCAPLGWPQAADLAAVVAKPISRSVDLPGDLQPFQNVTLHARVSGYVDRVLVDRGSSVRQGDLLVELSAPEITARIAEAQARAGAAESDWVQSEAQLAASQATFDRLKRAAETPGAVAGNELVQAEKQVQAGEALVRARQQAVQAAEAAVRAERDMEAYLKITAPFDGVVAERLVHPGALAGAGNGSPLLVLQQISRLRLVAAVPEEYLAGVVSGAVVTFRVAAFPSRAFSGTVARPAHAVDPKTRTMPIELDVANRDSALAPGMFATLAWPVRRSQPGLFVPKTSVVTTTERTFVVRDNDGKAEWVDVKKGVTEGDLIEVLGKLQPGDRVVKRASDELREGTSLKK